MDEGRGRAVRLTLDVGAGQRLGEVFIGAAAAATQWLLAGFFLGIAVGAPGFEADRGLGSRLLAGALAIGVFALGRYGRRRIRRALDTDTQLIVQSDDLVIRHGGVLPGPVVIPREAVAVVAVDPDASASSKHSLPVAAETGHRRLTWFWDLESGAPVPILGLPTRAPNLALLFNRHVDAGSLSGPGVLTRVNDSAAAERAFDAWGVLRQLTGDDLTRARELRP